MAGRGLGGAETYSTDVMLSFHKEGLDQCVVMAQDAPRFAELQAAGVRMAPDVLASPFRFVQRWKLRRLVQREKPDLIHCWMRRAASLLSDHSTKAVGWFGGYYDPTYFKRCQNLVGVTKDIVQHMIAKGIDPAHAFYIPTFPDVVPTAPLDRASLATPEKAHVLLALSRLHPKKGLDILLQALSHLPDCYLWLAGDGPLRQDLIDLADSLGVTSRVRFLGWRTDRAALLQAADVCVLPSRYEPFGTVILEAWATHTPFVACRSAGPAAHIEDGKNGLLVPIDDAEALTKAIRRMLDDEVLRQRVVDAGYATYSQSYTRDVVTQIWLAFYRQILGNKGEGGLEASKRFIH